MWRWGGTVKSTSCLWTAVKKSSERIKNKQWVGERAKRYSTYQRKAVQSLGNRVGGVGANKCVSYPLEEEGRAPFSQSLSPLHSGFSEPGTPDTDSTCAERTRCRNVLQHTHKYMLTWKCVAAAAAFNWIWMKSAYLKWILSKKKKIYLGFAFICFQAAVIPWWSH